MKRTRNMIYNETPESRELELFTENESALYPQYCAIIKNLQKHNSKGRYDFDKSIDAFYYLTDNASRLYNKYYGYTFTVGDRFTAATNMAKFARMEYIEGGNTL